MKKGDFSALRKARRKTTKDGSMLKKFKGDSREVTKDIMQTITSRLLSESSSPWFGAEILYVINTQKRNTRKGGRQDGPTATEKSSSVAHHDRYVAMLRKKDAPQSISLLRLTVKDGEPDIKNTFDLSVLRAIDFGSDDNELLLTFDQADHSLYFTTQNERDETLWIIIQVCKHIVRNDITVGYSIDVDALAYITSTSGTLTRFPTLQKMVQQHTKELGDYFSKEEIEAEGLLDELNWGSSLHEHSNLQHVLSGQAEQLNDEIIDFLLQWEEMDLTAKNKGKTTTAVAPNASAATSTTSPSTAVTPGKSSLAVAGRLAGASDTSEVLQALSQVDQELEAVDIWLGEQIGRLEEVQANLHMIEDESGALESSWQSLRSVQEVVTMLVERYSVSEKHEALLVHPEKVMYPIMRSPNLANAETAVAPLLEAMTVVRNALKLKFTDVADVTGPQWKQLQAMTSISSQRAKLNDIVETCCDAFTPTALGLFEWLLKHKAVLEAGVAVKQFTFTDALAEMSNGRSGRINFTTVPAWFTRIKSPQHNQLIKAKTALETHLQPFLPLLHLFAELAPRNLQPLRDAYVKSITEGFYKPLFKALAKDLLAASSAKHPLITLANVGKPKHRQDKTSALPLVFNRPTPGNGGGEGQVLTQMSPWVAFRTALMLVIPVLEQEESFVESFLRLGSSSGGSSVAPEVQQAFLAAIFDYIVAKFEVAIHVRTSLPIPAGGAGSNAGGGGGGGKDAMPLASLHGGLSSHGGASSHGASSAAGAGAGAGNPAALAQAGKDGMAAVAMLAVLTDFEAAYRDAVIIQYTSKTLAAQRNASLPGQRALRFADPSSNTNTSVALDGVPTARADEEALGQYLDLYLARSMETTRVALTARVGAYISDQINWIKLQKADPKNPDVLLPFASFPTFAAQVLEMSNGKRFDCVDALLMKVCKELFHWLTVIATQNDKYGDKIKIANLTYFVQTVPPLQLEMLEGFVANATQQRAEALQRYINWMVAYEFPSLSALAVRLDGVGKKVNEEELSLYIRRKDVLNVVKELELKTLEGMVTTMYKRLIKHFRSEFDSEMRLVERTWQQLRERIVGILARLEEAASLSYQIKLEVGPQVLGGLFDKVAKVTVANTSAESTER